VRAADTSIVVAAFAPWHEFHEAARTALRRDARLPAQAAFESYSVLTRLPAPFRAAPDVVVAFLRQRFPRPHLTLESDETRALLEELGRAGISGGATYDAVVGAAARRMKATLLTCDRRATRTYASLDVDYELIA
jgi:predicted nucleic acid-binding protein